MLVSFFLCSFSCRYPVSGGEGCVYCIFFFSFCCLLGSRWFFLLPLEETATSNQRESENKIELIFDKSTGNHLIGWKGTGCTDLRYEFQALNSNWNWNIDLSRGLRELIQPIDFFSNFFSNLFYLNKKWSKNKTQMYQKIPERKCYLPWSVRCDLASLNDTRRSLFQSAFEFALPTSHLIGKSTSYRLNWPKRALNISGVCVV